MSDERLPTGERGSAMFVLAHALRGRAPAGPPPPRVLDVLLLRRARARFLASAAVEPGAAGESLPWRETGLEGFPPETRPAPAGAEVAAGGGREWEHAPRPAPMDVGRDPEVRDAAPSPAGRGEAAAPQAGPAPAERGDIEPRPPTRYFRQPFFPALAPPTAPAGRVDDSGAPPAVGAAPPVRPVDLPPPVTVRRDPAPGGAPVAPAEPPLVASPFAAPAVVSRAASPERERDAGSPRRRASDRGPAPGPARAADPPRLALRPPAPPELRWAEPVVAEPRRVVPAVLPFVPSPGRSAAATAERVAREVSRRERQAFVAVAPTPERARSRVTPAAAARDEARLTGSGFLHEVTRDNVVRALAARMRALAHEDRFRLGELR